MNYDSRETMEDNLDSVEAQFKHELYKIYDATSNTVHVDRLIWWTCNQCQMDNTSGFWFTKII